MCESLCEPRDKCCRTTNGGSKLPQNFQLIKIKRNTRSSSLTVHFYKNKSDAQRSFVCPSSGEKTLPSVGLPKHRTLHISAMAAQMTTCGQRRISQRQMDIWLVYQAVLTLIYLRDKIHTYKNSTIKLDCRSQRAHKDYVLLCQVHHTTEESFNAVVSSLPFISLYQRIKK